MRAVVWLGAGELEVRDVAEPIPGAGETVVSVVAAGVCGSDLHAYRGRAGGRVPPLVLGHEATVEDAAGVRYAVFPLLACGSCVECLRGAANLCVRRGLVGLSRAGLLADRVALPSASLVPLPDGMDPITGSLVEPLAAAMHVIRVTGLGPGARVLVIGCGAIGLLAVHALAGLGAIVDAVDPVGPRTAVATLLGAARVATDTAAFGDAAAGYDLVVDAVGVESTWADGIAAVRNGGTIAMVGLGAVEGRLEMGAIVRRGLTVLGIYAYTRGDFDAALRLLAERSIPIGWVTVRPLEEAVAAFAALHSDPGSSVKTVFLPGAPA